MSKGGNLLRMMLGAAKQFTGHGPQCPATCPCRAADLVVSTGVAALESAVQRSKRKRRAAPVQTVEAVDREPVEVVADVIDVEVIEVDGVPVTPLQRPLLRPSSRSLPSRRSRAPSR